jgi:hypothetical protein
MAKRNRAPVLGGQSKLLTSESYTDPKMTALHSSMRNGSQVLLAAILRTGKLYRNNMTAAEINSMYAYLRGEED